MEGEYDVELYNKKKLYKREEGNMYRILLSFLFGRIKEPCSLDWRRFEIKIEKGALRRYRLRFDV